MRRARRTLFPLLGLSLGTLFGGCSDAKVAGGAALTNDFAGLPLGEVVSFLVRGLTGAGLNNANLTVDLSRIAEGALSADNLLVALTSSDGTFNNDQVDLTSVTNTAVTGTVEVETEAGRARQQTLTFTIQIEFLPDGTILVTIIFGNQSAQGIGFKIQFKLGEKPKQPSAEQAKAIGDFLEALRITGPVIGSLIHFVVDNDSPPDGGLVAVGNCPHITASRSGDTLNIAFDFGTGCSSANTGNMTIAGVANVVHSVSSSQSTMTFTNFTAAGRSITGQVAVQLLPPKLSTTRSRAEVTLDIQLAGLGSIVGPVTVRLRKDGQTSYSSDGLTSTSGAGKTYESTVRNARVAANPATYLPFKGVSVMSAPNGDKFTISYKSTTPTQGKVVINGKLTDVLDF